MRLLFTILIALVVEIALLYPITSMFGTCASYPLEDLFFEIYWPGAEWLRYQGVNHFWATFLVVAIPNNLIVGLLGRVDLFCTYFAQQYIGSHININASDTMLA